MKGQLAVLAADHFAGTRSRARHRQRALCERSTGGYRLGLQNRHSQCRRRRTGHAAALPGARTVAIDGRPAEADRSGGLRHSVPNGHHVLTGASPLRKPPRVWRRAGVWRAASARRPWQRGRGIQADRRGAAGSNGRQGRRSVTDMITMASPQGPRLCVAEGTTVTF